MAIRNTTLTGTASSIFTSTDGANAIVTTYFCNPTASTININVYAVSGTLDTSANVIYYDRAITPGDTFVLDTEKLLLEPGESLYASVANGSGTIATVITTKI